MCIVFLHDISRHTRCRILYEKHLSRQKRKNVITMDESRMYVNECNKKRSIYYHQREEKNLKSWFIESKESFSKRFMIVVDFAHNGKLKIKRREEKCKDQLHILSGTRFIFNF